MLSPEKYFDDTYEYVDLWVGGFIKAYQPNSEGEIFSRLKNRVVEALMNRFEVINKLRKSIGLEEMDIEHSYDYYVNNLPEYNDRKNVVDLYTYDVKTRELSEKEEHFHKNPDAQAHLCVMGAPDILIENSRVLQERLDHINRLLVAGGYEKITPRKTEEILSALLMEQSGSYNFYAEGI